MQENRKNTILGCLLVLGLAVSQAGPLSAQNYSEEEMMMGAPGRMQQGMDVTRAAQNARTLTNRILQYVSTNQPLQVGDVNHIKENLLSEISRFQGKFQTEDKALLYLARAYLAHYSGEQDEALKLAQQAQRIAPENSDINDSIIVLALCYEKYSLVQGILRKREAGASAKKQELASKWGDPAGRSGPTGSRRPAPRSDPRMASSAGILNLPVDHMPYENLGKDFHSVQLQTVNGSYFFYEPRQGPILCLLLWEALGEETEKTESRRAPPSRSVRKRTPPVMDEEMMEAGLMAPSWGSRSARTMEHDVPQVGFDLQTNAEQFKDIFGKGILSGKIEAVAINFNSTYDKAKVVRTLIEEPWPWATCMASAPANQTHWNLEVSVTPVMMIVGTEGKIRYVGPVGGFLPQMLIGMEWDKAHARAEMAPPQVTSPAEAATPSQGGFIGQMLGGANQETSAAFGAGIGSTPSAVQPGPAPRTETKISNPQAQKILQTAYVQKKMSKRLALRSCDKVIESYPDSIEADQAREMIRNMIRADSRMKEERKKQGKYIGE